MFPRAISLLGPTASGKSAIAMALALHFPQLVLINADSQQVYADMLIGTGSPSVEDRARVSHHLYNFFSPREAYDVGRYLDDVTALLHSLPRDRVPLFVGGSGFYQRALWQGVPDLAKDEIVRARLRERLERDGLAPLVTELRERDPETARVIDLNNPVRVLRALEVFEMTGQSFLTFKTAREPIEPLRETSWLKLGVSLSRERVYAQADQRVQEMVKHGLFDEVADLRRQYGDDAWALTRCLGYPESIRYLKGEQTRDATIAQIQQNTRNYAKRQWTWFRRETELVWIESSRAGDRDINRASMSVENSVDVPQEILRPYIEEVEKWLT